MKKTLYSALILVFAMHIAFGQAKKTKSPVLNQVKKEDLVAIKSRPLIIARTGRAQVDKDIETLVKKIWTFNSEVLFYSVDDIKAKLKVNEAGYSILSFDLINYALANKKVPEGANGWVRASLKLSERYNKPAPAFFQDISAGLTENTMTLHKREIIFALHVIQNHLRTRDAGKKSREEMLANQGLLAKKTLLIDEKFMDDKFTAADMKQNYPFAFKVVKREVIEKAQLEKNKDCAFLELTPIGDEVNLLTHLIINCEDGEQLSYGEFYNGFGDSYSNFVNKSHAEAYAKYSDYKAYKENKKSK
jgi:hypothetical protein